MSKSNCGGADLRVIFKWNFFDRMQISMNFCPPVFHHALKLVRVAEKLDGPSQVADGNQL
jgi:hypothetical protein